MRKQYLITPQEYFETPFHFDFKDYNKLPDYEGHYDDLLEDFFTNDIVATYEKEFPPKINEDGEEQDDFDYDHFENYHTSYPYSFFIIDWNFIFLKLSDEFPDDEKESTELKTNNYIQELINFMKPGIDVQKDYETINEAILIVKVKKVLRNISEVPINEESRIKHRNFFNDYKNLGGYYFE